MNHFAQCCYFLCGVVVGLIVLERESVAVEAGREWPTTESHGLLPAEFVISENRLARTTLYDLATMI